MLALENSAIVQMPTAIKKLSETRFSFIDLLYFLQIPLFISVFRPILYAF
jgi:hypothetical protein